VVLLLLVDFFGAAFVTGAAFVAVLFAVTREAGLLPDFAALRAGVVGAADASMSGLAFFGRTVARTCLIAFACCSSVIRNSWWPSRLATK
jgi:hypothetical protein